MASLYGISIKLTADLKNFSTNLQNAERQFERFGKKMQSIGRQLALGVSIPIIAMGAGATKTFAEFEQSMAKVEAVSGATQKEFKQLSELARELGKSTKFSASEVAGLELEFSKLGFIPSQIQDLTSSTLQLATVADTDLANAATVAGATMRSFEIQANNAQRVVDVMASSFSSSALDMDKFSVAMSIVAPVAKSAGKSLEQTTAQLSTLVNRGIDASTAGTALRNVFLKLSEQGITWSQAVSKINSSIDKNAAALKLFGTRGATVAQILAANGEEISQLTQKYNNAAGSADEMAAIMNDTLLVTFEKLMSGVSELGIAFGEVLKPVLLDVIDKVNGLVDWFNSMDSGGKNIVATLAIMAASVGPVIYAVGSASRALGFLTGHFRNLSVAARSAAGGMNVAKVAMASIPAVAVVGALTTIALSVYSASDAYNEAANSAQNFNNAIDDNAVNVYDLISTKLEFIGNQVNRVAATSEEFAEELKKLDVSQLERLKSVIDNKLVDANREFANAIGETAKETARFKQEKLSNELELINSEIEKGKFNTDAINASLRETIDLIPKLTSISEIKPLEIKAPAPGLSKEKPKNQTSIADSIQAEINIMREYATAVDQVSFSYTQLNNTGNKFADLANTTQQALTNLVAIGVDPASESMQNLINSFQSLDKKSKHVDILKSGFAEMGTAIGTAAAQGGDAMKNLGATMLGVVKKMLGMFLAEAIGAAIAKSMSSSGNPILGLALAAGASAAVTALFSAKVPKLAGGGLAFGPTYAMVGDNPNAASDPEVISPLSKLKGIIGNNSMPREIWLRARGEDLTGVIRTYNRKNGGVH